MQEHLGWKPHIGHVSEQLSRARVAMEPQAVSRLGDTLADAPSGGLGPDNYTFAVRRMPDVYLHTKTDGRTGEKATDMSVTVWHRHPDGGESSRDVDVRENPPG